MNAARFHGAEEGLAIEDVPRPEPGPGDVLVRVGACGLCHTDLHIMDGSYAAPTPITLGHEIAGEVAETGPGVNGVDTGEAVVVFGGWGCGDCTVCNQGEDQLCNPSSWVGGGNDGGFAEYVLVPDQRYVIPIDGVDAPRAAPLTDAALTPYRAVNKARSRLTPASTIVLIGIGGLGHYGVQFAATTGARTVAVDLDAERLDAATRLGADAVIDASAERVPTRINQLTDNRGADAVIDFVGSDETLSWGVNALGPKARLVLVGMAGGSVPFAWNPLIGSEAEFVSVDWGSLPELRDVVSLAERGRLETEIQQVDFDELESTYERMEHGELTGRAVLVP